MKNGRAAQLVQKHEIREVPQKGVCRVPPVLRATLWVAHAQAVAEQILHPDNVRAHIVRRPSTF